MINRRSRGFFYLSPHQRLRGIHSGGDGARVGDGDDAHVPLAVIAAAALAFGIYEAGAPAREQRADHPALRDRLEHGQDYGAMWAVAEPASSQRHMPRTEFAAEMSGAAQTATVSALHPAQDPVDPRSDRAESASWSTHVFGQLQRCSQIPLAGGGGGTRVVFNTSLLFPGLRSGELLSRKTVLGQARHAAGCRR